MRAFAFAALLGLAACATPCPPAADTGPIVKHFRCETLETFTATFTRNPDQARVEEPGYEPVVLAAQLAGSGYRYGAAGVELRGRGDEARITRPGGGERLCHEAR